MSKSDDERPGLRLITLRGRGYPTAEAAQAKMREMLARDGIIVPDEDISARRWTDKPVLCPWEPVAWIPEEMILPERKP